MDAMYPYFLIIHIVCAIIFLGYIFADVVVFTPVRKILKQAFNEEQQKVLESIFSGVSKRAVKIMPLCLFMLVLSGGAMISRYIGIEKGFFDTPLQMALVVKAGFGLIIFAMVCISLSCKFLGVKNPLASIIHPLALVLGFCIVLLAKIAFYM